MCVSACVCVCVCECESGTHWLQTQTVPVLRRHVSLQEVFFKDATQAALQLNGLSL